MITLKISNEYIIDDCGKIDSTIYKYLTRTNYLEPINKLHYTS